MQKWPLGGDSNTDCVKSPWFLNGKTTFSYKTEDKFDEYSHIVVYKRNTTLLNNNKK